MSNRLRTALVIVVTTVWVVSVFAPLLVKTFQPPAEINGAFMLIVAATVASYNRK